MNGVNYLMATEFALDVTPATRSLSALKQSVSVVTRGWQSQVAMLKQAGQGYQAMQAKTQGLQKALELQQKVMDDLEKKNTNAINLAKNKAEEQKRLTSNIRDTTKAMQEAAKAGGKQSQTYKDLRNELKNYQQEQRALNNVDKTIRQTTSQLEYQRTKYISIKNALTEAKEQVDNYDSGLEKLRSSYQVGNELATARISRLEAEGQKTAALREKTQHYTQNVESLTKQLKAEKDQLLEMSNRAGSSEAYTKQQIAVEKTAEALAKAKTNAASAKSELESLQPHPWVSLRNKILGVDSARAKAQQNIEKAKGVFSGTFLANTVSNILPSASGELKKIASEGQQVATAGAVMQARWKNIGVSGAGIKSLTEQVGDLKTNTNMSAGAVNTLQSKLYGVTHSVSQTKQITQGVGALADQLKLSGDQADGFAGGLNRIESAGKVSSRTLGRLEKQAPGLTTALANASGMTRKKFQDLVSSGKMTSDQFNQILMNASKSYQKNAKAFTSTAGGARHALEQQWKSTEAKIAKPLIAVQAQVFGQLRQSLSQKDTQKGLVLLAQGFGKAAVEATKFLGVLAKHQGTVKAVGAGLLATVGTLKAFSAINSTIMTFQLLGKSLQAAGIGVKALNLALGAGVIGLIAGLSVGLFELYKHNSKFRHFVNGIWSSVKNGLGKAINFIKHDWKQIALFIVNPIAGGLSLLYKHNKTFRNWANGVGRSIKNGIGRGWNGLKSIWSNIIKANVKQGQWEIKTMQNIGNSIAGFFTKSIPNAINSSNKAISKAVSFIINLITKPFKNMFNWLKDQFSKIGTGIKSAGSRIKKHLPHFATGTGSLSDDELAVVNDAHDPNYREAMLYNGMLLPFPNKRNFMTLLPKGAKVVEGNTLAKLQAKHYASGDSDSVSLLVNGIEDDSNHWKGAAYRQFMTKLREEFNKQMKKFQDQIIKANQKLQQALQKAYDKERKAQDETQQRYNQTITKLSQRRSEAQSKAQQRLHQTIAKAEATKMRGLASHKKDPKGQQKVLNAFSEATKKAFNTFSQAGIKAQQAYSKSAQQASVTEGRTYNSVSSAVGDEIQRAEDESTRTIGLAKLNIQRLDNWFNTNQGYASKQLQQYAHGGFSDHPAVFGERGLEAAVPINQMEEGNAWQQVVQIASMYAGNGGRMPGQQNPAEIADKVVNAVNRLADLISNKMDDVTDNQKGQIAATKGIDGYYDDKVIGTISSALHYQQAGNMF